jgi:O-acetyl-ADP-ribose deacetylase (regulator of RNase III)
LSWKDRVSLTQGDIALADTMAVVSAANHELWMGSGVAGALRRAGGAVIEQEAVKQGPVAVGDAVITSGGSLKAMHVIHAVSMVAGRPTTADAIARATASALRLAAQEGIVSIAFPALGTGAGCAGFLECADAMLGAIREHCEESELPQDIRLMLFGDNALEEFRRVFELLH